LGAPAGFLAANGFFLILGLILTPDQFRDWGWRIPFAVSALLVAVGLWIRLKLAETPQFAAALAEAEPPKIPLATLIQTELGPLVGGTLGAVACFVLYYLATAFALGYGVKNLGFTMEQMLSVQLGAILLMGVGIVLAAWAADRHWDERRVLIGGCVAAILLGFLVAPLMGSGSLWGMFAFLSVALFVMGFTYGPLGGWLPSLYPPLVRYTGVSMAFNLAGILGGGLTPFAAQALAGSGGLALVGLYCSGLAVISLVALLALGARR
ncbi:MFS transporter, partial [Sphingomonas sp.]|uniref:MFS transporter n=1 Tax=Sphingomonas sp. TaxID=28214 RepID=UPI003B3AB6EA